MKPTISKNNDYFVEKHRYYELKHFCLQYPEWKKALDSLDSSLKSPSLSTLPDRNATPSNPTEKIAYARAYYSERIAMVEESVREADADLYGYLLQTVTEGMSYDSLKAHDTMPVGRAEYYARLRKLYWLIHLRRQ